MAGRSRPPLRSGGQPERRPWHIGLGASLLVHVLAVVLLAWLTFPSAETVPRHDPTTVVSFESPEFEPPQPPSIAPAPPRSTPRPVPPPGPSPDAAPTTTAKAEQVPGAEVPPPAQVPGAASELPPQVAGEPPPGDAVGDTDSENAVAPPSATGAPRRLDLERALREFRHEAVDRPGSSAPAVVSPPGSASGLEPSSAPPSGFGMDNLSFESTDFDWNDYRRQIYWAIWRAWHWRLYQTTNEFDRWAFAQSRWYLDHASQIRFVIERSGDITGVVIERGSGCEPLDRSAVDALVEVNLPPLPAAFPREREVVHARFIAIADIREMRRHLQYLHQAGHFP